MKNFKYILPAIALLIFASCDSDDDGFYNTRYVQAENLVLVETQPSFTVGDVIYVDASVPKLLSEPGETTLLDVVQTTGGASTFSFSYILEKKDPSGEWLVFDISNDFVDGGEGTSNVGSFVQGILEYNNVSESYNFRGGIQLSEPGEYRLNFTNTTDYSTKAALRSDSVQNNIVLNIFSTIPGLNQGYYEFIVN